MAVQAIAITGASNAAYLAAVEAQQILATLPGLTAARAASTDAINAALLLASIDIDGAMRYQGRKYASAQEREFPRITGQGSIVLSSQVAGYAIDPCPGLTVWDWDSTTNTAVVPEQVKLACVIQADSILAGDRDERLAAIHDGVTTQAADGLQEVYAGEAKSLCRRAWAMMSKYRLRSGAML